MVLDLGPAGAGIEHSEKLAANEVYLLKVDWRQPFQAKVRVRHSQLRKLADQSGPSIFHTGLSFVGISENASVVVDSILIDEVKRKVTEWEANLTGTRRNKLPGINLERPRSSLPTGYVWYRLVNGKWVSITTRDPNQPVDGFAVRDDEDSEQIKLLCKTYEFYDEEDRQMLRMMAHLAIASRAEPS